MIGSWPSTVWKIQVRGTLEESRRRYLSVIAKVIPKGIQSLSSDMTISLPSQSSTGGSKELALNAGQLGRSLPSIRPVSQVSLYTRFMPTRWQEVACPTCSTVSVADRYPPLESVCWATAGTAISNRRIGLPAQVWRHPIHLVRSNPSRSGVPLVRAFWQPASTSAPRLQSPHG